jgi:colanic acid/amylovoran biosynthesis glycosyltransferase
VRVALVVREFPLPSETFIVQKTLGLLERGFDVHVVCRASRPSAWARFPELAGRPDLRRRVHVIPQSRPLPVLACLALPSVLGTAARRPAQARRYASRGVRLVGVDTIRRVAIDSRLLALSPRIVHVEFADIAAERPHLGELLGARVVVSVRGADINYLGLETPGFYDRVWGDTDVLHCLGDDLWRRALRRGCPPGKPHVIIPPAIDTGRFLRHAPPDGMVAGTRDRPLRVLSVGRLTWKKGHEFALAAVRNLSDRGLAVEYRIAGDGRHREAIEYGVEQLGLADRVTLLGSLPHDRVRAELEHADVLMHAAVSEGFGNAVLEAQAMEVPVVCSDADGLRENVADGVSGFVVPRRNPIALADGLARLAADPAARERMGRSGRERVTRQFRLDDQLDAFERLYRDLLAGRVPPTRYEAAGREGG